MVAATRSRASPLRTCTFLSPKPPQPNVARRRTRAYARAAAAAFEQKLAKEEGEERATRRPKRKCSSSPAQRSSLKKEILIVIDSSSSSSDAEAGASGELDLDNHQTDYDPESADECETKRKMPLQSPKEFPSIVAPPSHYESLRLQRIEANKARMAALGVQKHAESLTSFFRVSKPKRTMTKTQRIPLERRCSERLKTNSLKPGFYSPSSSDSCASDSDESPKLQLVLKDTVYRNYQDEENGRPGNAPLPKHCPLVLQVSPVLSALRCRSKERGTLYDAIVGICCHFCRQKKLCGEEDCERCGQRDVTKPCLGKSDCSKCHSSTGVFCRACLKIRYGEDIVQVRERGDWICAHCSEEEGRDPYWICNSSLCLSRKKIPPTGIAIYKAREMGYKSVAHYLADLLKQRALK